MVRSGRGGGGEGGDIEPFRAMGSYAREIQPDELRGTWKPGKGDPAAGSCRHRAEAKNAGGGMIYQFSAHGSLDAGTAELTEEKNDTTE